MRGPERCRGCYPVVARGPLALVDERWRARRSGASKASPDPLYPPQYIADVSGGDAAAGREVRRFFVTLGAGRLRATNPAEERIVALIEPTATELGYRLVRVRLSGNRRKRLQIMAERLSDGQMGIEDCERLSRAISPIFDLEDPIQGEFDLELSSPGIDRPLMRVEDFERFVGYEAKAETAAMVNGQRRFKGVIASVAGEAITLTTEHGDVTLNFSQLSDARLVLTDKLIELDLRRAKAAEAAEKKEHDEGKTS